jgi:hypothetical protein
MLENPGKSNLLFGYGHFRSLFYWWGFLGYELSRSDSTLNNKTQNCSATTKQKCSTSLQVSDHQSGCAGKREAFFWGGKVIQLACRNYVQVFSQEKEYNQHKRVTLGKVQKLSKINFEEAL